jgi:hypothetical protein
LTRYLEIIGRVAAEVSPDLGPGRDRPFEAVFENDDPDRAERVKRLRAARESIAAHLAMIDKELGELESSGARREEMSAIVEVKNLSKRFSEEVLAVDGISFTV